MSARINPNAVIIVVNSVKPKAIFFDLDETLIENKIPVPKLFARMYFDFETSLGIENQAAFFESLRANAANLWATMFERDEAPESQFVACFATSIAAINAVPATEQHTLAQAMFDRFLELSANNVVFHHDALQTLQDLQSQGYITGIITNGMERVQLGKINKLDLYHKVDHVIVSAQARAHKPHKPVFDLALTRANVAPHQAWQIGDHALNDVAGAIRAGMSGVFYDPSQQRRERAFDDIPERPTHIISSLNEVLSLTQ
ncbi:HAD family hydrolase [Arenicella xantha]|uniref:HAD superfamily hydrolase (TIGR01509 family)/HAD superfamily hydrolase (TIGR01549 family) n=1 Tax=Arenicella xantha TaxID=644221 RepID=A0A395JU50_9GAMM|nr:HAD family hydrolase [Arenicella xantha]RBP53068.1 HAD superfamily hydrolase (TIGR01509 family)/HAD superfamily hydrolase (TIGR01549 family) [Arenicella xantha]